MADIPKLPVTTPHQQITAALRTAGAVVIQGVTDESYRRRLMAELAPHIDAARIDAEVDPEEFYPGQTRRVTALVRRAPAFTDLALHPAMKQICDDILLPNCERYQLHVGSALVVGPGARVQVLHREDDPFEFFPVPRPDLVVASMWAMTDFTRENGATLIVPGSHLWPAGREAQAAEVLPAEMAAGDVLVWLGGTLHGAGENISNDWRYGVFASYSAGWLRQEENQFVDAPWEVARELPPAMRELLGYKMHRGLGFYDPA